MNENYQRNSHLLFDESAHGQVFLRHLAIRCEYQKCRKFMLIVSVSHRPDMPGNYRERTMQSWTLLPNSLARPQPDYIPKPVRDDYYEASLISDKSPKASATLSRRCLQGMIRDFWHISRPTLHQEIMELEGKVAPEVWSAIDSVRKIGNIGAHMEKDINVIVDVEHDEAALLLELVEMLFQEWYIARRMRQAQLEKIKEVADSKDNIRKNIVEEVEVLESYEAEHERNAGHV